MKKPDEILLQELHGHPLQDYVDTVRAVVFNLKAHDESIRTYGDAHHENVRGSERTGVLRPLPGVRAEHLDTNEYLIHRVAHSLFLKNQFS